MIYRILITANLFLLVVFNAAGQQNVPDSIKLPWDLFTLKNGIRVLFQPDASRSTATVEFWVRMGARDELPGKFGFAHFFEHATPYGLKKDSVALKQFTAARKNSNAQTRKDYTRYFVEVSPESLALALKYTRDRLQADTAAILDNVVAVHKQNVLNEIGRQERNPWYSASVNSRREQGTFGFKHPYGHSTYGSLAENRSFTTQEIKEWYKKFFAAGNIILFVTGKFNPDETKEIIKREFEPIGSKTILKEKRIPEPATSPAKQTITAPVEFHNISITWAIPGLASSYSAALQLLSRIIDNRLKKSTPVFSMRAHGSDQLFNVYQYAGQFGIYASFTLQSDTAAVERFLHTVITDIQKNGTTEPELKKAKSDIINEIEGMQKTLGFIGSRTELLGEGLLFADNPDHYLISLQKQSNLSSNDLVAALNKTIRGGGFRLLILSTQLVN